MTYSKIDQIHFWKRDPNSVEIIHEINFKFDKYKLITNTGITLEKEETKELLDHLYNDYDIENTKNEYTAFLYEDDKNNFNIKFFLKITYKNGLYTAIKGILPFKQDHYNDIINLFNKYLTK